MDPIALFFSGFWGEASGYTLWVATVGLFLFGFFKRWWVPGWLYKEKDAALKESEKVREGLLNLVVQMAASLGVTTEFFQKVGEVVSPKRGEKASAKKEDAS